MGIGRRRWHSSKRRSLAGNGGTIGKGGHWQNKVAQLEGKGRGCVMLCKGGHWAWGVTFRVAKKAESRYVIQ